MQSPLTKLAMMREKVRAEQQKEEGGVDPGQKRQTRVVGFE